MDPSKLSKSKVIKGIIEFHKQRLHTLILIGLVLRFILAPFLSDPNDIRVLYIVTNNLLSGLNIYTTNSFSYPPLWAYIEFPSFRVASFFASPGLFGIRVNALNVSNELWKFPPVITSPLFNVLCKLPLIAADLLIGFIIYSIVKEKRDEKLARISFMLWFFNPLVIGIDAVQGQFDVLPTLMTVLSFCLFFRRSYFASGVAIGVGALFKVYPVFLVPLYLFSIAAMEIKEMDTVGKFKSLFAGCLKFVIGILVPVFLFLVPLLNSNLIHDLFARAELISSIGGLTPFSIIYLPGMNWIFSFFASNSSLVSLILIAICFATVTFIGFISFKGRKDFLKTFVFANIAAILTIYMTSLTVNPQYVLWVLPFLILGYGLYGYNYNKIRAFSISALLLLIGLNGPLLLYPLAASTPLLSLPMIWNGKYFFDSYGGWATLVIGSIVGIITLVLCLKNTISTLAKDRKCGIGDDAPHEVENDRSDFGGTMINPSRILTVFLIVLLLGQFLAFTQPLVNQTVSFDVLSLSKDNESIGIDYNIKSGNYPTDLQVIATVTFTAQQVTDKEILIYYDADYPSSVVSRAGWIGLLDHIPIELQLRNYQGPIKIVNAVGLRHEMETNFNAIVIIPSGVFPGTIHGENRTLVGNWIRAGGTLIWIGDAFAQYTGYSGGVVKYFSTESLIDAQNQTLGIVLFNETLTGNESFATIESNFSNALDLQYIIASTGAYVSRVLSYGGIALGKITNSENARTATASIPIGMGHLVLFGGGAEKAFTATGEDVAAHDIAQILCSGALFSTGTITYNSHAFNRDESMNGSITLLVPISQNVGIIVAAFSKSSYVYFFSREFYIV